MIIEQKWSVKKKVGVTDHLREQTASEVYAMATHPVCV